MMRASFFYYPEHLIFTFAHKSQGGGTRTTAPPCVRYTAYEWKKVGGMLKLFFIKKTLAKEGKKDARF